MKKEYFDALFDHLSKEQEDGEEDTAGRYKYRNPKTGEILSIHVRVYIGKMAPS